MTESDVVGVMGYINQRWSHVPLEAHTLPVWREDLGDQPVAEAMAAIRSWALTGDRFPPTSGWVRSEIERGSQAAAPSAADGQRLFARIVARCAPYDAKTPRDTAATIERMAALGVHEALLRWVQAAGVYAIRMMPDSELLPLDANQLADRRDLYRDYERNVLPDWRADPRPGIALQRAHAAAELGEASGRLGLRRPSFQRALEAAEPEMSAAEAAEEIRQARLGIECAGADKRAADRQRRVDLDSLRRAEDERVAAAERELAEYAQARQEPTR